MFPDMASSISLSVGLEFSASSTAALMIWPDWQYPHCGTSISIHASCRGCVRSGEIPSIVVIFFPSARETGATQDQRLAINVHGAGAALRHPASVFGAGKFQRIANHPEQRRRRRIATLTAFPLTVNEIKRCLLTFLPDCDAKGYGLKNGAPRFVKQMG